MKKLRAPRLPWLENETREEYDKRRRPFNNKRAAEAMKIKRHENPEWNESQVIKYHSNLHSKLVNAQHGAKERNLIWEISEEYVQSLGNICYWSGVELTFIKKKPNTWSLDRLDNSRGYVEGNIVPCCARINIARRTMSLDEFKNMCSSVAKHQRKKLKNKI